MASVTDVCVTRPPCMMTSSNGNICRVTGPLCGEFSGHKDQWRGAVMFSLICAWINGLVNNREVGDLRHHRAHYDVTVMGLLYTRRRHLVIAVPSNDPARELVTFYSTIPRISWFLIIWRSPHDVSPLQWRHNDQDGVSNHQPRGCLLNRLSRRRSKKTSKLRVTGLCVGN